MLVINDRKENTNSRDLGERLKIIDISVNRKPTEKSFLQGTGYIYSCYRFLVISFKRLLSVFFAGYILIYFCSSRG